MDDRLCERFDDRSHRFHDRLSVLNPPAEFLGFGPSAFRLDLDPLDFRRLGSVAASLLFPLIAFSRGIRRLSLLDLTEEPFTGNASVCSLGPGFLDMDDDAGRDMPKAHASGDLVHILSSRTGRPGEDFLKVVVVEMSDSFHSGEASH